MTKRNPGMEKRPRDFYPTPKEAVLPLIPHLIWETFAEPCAGECDLIRHLEEEGYQCLWASDIKEPRGGMELDALDLEEAYLDGVDCIVTNPPWSRDILHPMIEHFRNLRPTWLLLDADWMFTKQARPHLKFCKKIVSVGRVRWIPGTKSVGFDNCAWYLFLDTPHETIFVNGE